MDSLLAWIIRRGELTAKLEYKIEQDKLDAKNDILVGNLQVAPSRASDEVKKRIGLPLGLIVALIKDGTATSTSTCRSPVRSPTGSSISATRSGPRSGTSSSIS